MAIGFSFTAAAQAIVSYICGVNEKHLIGAAVYAILITLFGSWAYKRYKTRAEAPLPSPTAVGYPGAPESESLLTDGDREISPEEWHYSPIRLKALMKMTAAS